jgi:hypothetical protein
MNNELEKLRKEAVRTEFKVLSLKLRGRTGKIITTFNPDSQCSGQTTNRAPSEPILNIQIAVLWVLTPHSMVDGHMMS